MDIRNTNTTAKWIVDAQHNAKWLNPTALYSAVKQQLAMQPPLRTRVLCSFVSITASANKLISGLSEVRYEERLEILGLTTLETRRLREDLMEVFKILEGYENIDQEVFFDRPYVTVQPSWSVIKVK